MKTVEGYGPSQRTVSLQLWDIAGHERCAPPLRSSGGIHSNGLSYDQEHPIPVAVLGGGVGGVPPPPTSSFLDRR